MTRIANKRKRLPLTALILLLSPTGLFAATPQSNGLPEAKPVPADRGAKDQEDDVHEMWRLLAASPSRSTTNQRLDLADLLASKDRVDARISDGVTPLMLSAFLDRDDVVSYLIQRKAAIDAQDNDGWTALMYAAAKGNVKSVWVLLDHHADIKARTRDGRTAVIYAAKNGRTAVRDLLIDHGVDVTAADVYGFNAAQYAEAYARQEAHR